MMFDDVLKIVLPIAVIVAPLFKILFTINSRLDRIEQRLDMEKKQIDEVLERHDRHIHEIRNSLTAITLLLARKGITHEE